MSEGDPALLAAKGYDAVYFHLTTTDPDPAVSADFWLSGGIAQVWNFGPNARASAWERQVDQLMARQMASQDQAERQRLFAEVQQIFAAHLPMIHFAPPRVNRTGIARGLFLREDGAHGTTQQVFPRVT